jgi:hypothetical protein
VWIDRPEPDAAARPAEQGPVLAFDPADVLRLEIDRSSGKLALERKAADAWTLTEPAGVEADPTRVDELLRSLGDARTVAVVEEKGGDGSRFGLAPPELTVRLTLRKEPKLRTLRLGRKSPVGFERYAAADDGKIVLADASLATALERSPDELEQKRLLPVSVEDIRRIVVRRPEGALALERAEGGWRLTEPLRDTADDAAADALARSITTLAVTKRTVPQPPHGAPPIEIEVATSAGTRRVAIEGGVASREDGTLAGTVEEASLRDIERKPDELRDRRVAILPAQGIRGVAIETSGKKLRAWREKDDGPWKVAADAGPAGDADARKVEGWIDRLRWARAEGFEEASAFQPLHVVTIEGASGAIGRIEIAAEAAGKVAVRSSFRPGAVLTVSTEALAPVPATPADLAPDAKAP